MKPNHTYFKKCGQKLILMTATALSTGIITTGINIQNVAAADTNVHTIQKTPDWNHFEYMLENGNLSITTGSLGAGTLSTALKNDGVDIDQITAIKLSVSTYLTAKNAGLFSSFPNLKEVTGLGHLMMGRNTSLQGLFKNDPKLKTVDFINFDFEKVTDMSEMFENSGMETFDFSKINLTNVTKMNSVFKNTPLKTIKFSENVPKKMTDLSSAFENTKLTTIDISKLGLDQATKLDNIFNKAPLQEITVPENTKLTTVGLLPSLNNNDQPDEWKNNKSDSVITFKDFTTKSLAKGTYLRQTKPAIPAKPTPKPTKPQSKPAHHESQSNTSTPSVPTTSAPDKHKQTKPKAKNKVVIFSTPKLISTHQKAELITLYDSDLHQLSTRSLTPNSDWLTDQKKTVNGQTYYRVSKSEWVKATDVYQYQSKDHTVSTKPGDFKKLVTAKGSVSNRTLATNSEWYSDRTTMINGQLFHRISTNEFVSDNDIITK